MNNLYIAQQRAQFAAQIADPATRDQVCAMMITEDAADPVPCLESLLNRIVYCNSCGWKQTVLAMIHSGFYGPYNRGMYPRTIRQLHASPALQAKMDAAIATVMAGSDLIHGFTDQGLPTDPNGQRQPQMRLGGNIFNDWGGGPGGHNGAETWRQGFEAAAAGVAPPPVPAVAPTVSKVNGAHMIQTNDTACHGLLVGWPVDQLAAYINGDTPPGIHFNVTGGSDPRPMTDAIIDKLIASKVPNIFLGHSLGAMLSFYAADALKAKGIRSPLFISIDSTFWGTNAPGVDRWSTLVFPPNTGKYFVPDNVDRWLHFYQDGAPGGGVAELAPGNTRTDLRVVHLPGENHLSIVNSKTVRDDVLASVLWATQAA